jgi:hypothetical protein
MRLSCRIYTDFSAEFTKEVSGGLAGRWHTGVMANPEHLAKLKKGVEAWNE